MYRIIDRNTVKSNFGKIVLAMFKSAPNSYVFASNLIIKIVVKNAASIEDIDMIVNKISDMKSVYVGWSGRHYEPIEKWLDNNIDVQNLQLDEAYKILEIYPSEIDFPSIQFSGCLSYVRLQDSAFEKNVLRRISELKNA